LTTHPKRSISKAKSGSNLHPFEMTRQAHRPVPKRFHRKLQNKK